MFNLCTRVSHHCVSVGVMQQPSLSQDSTSSPLSVMHRLHDSHQGDVGAETRTDGERRRERQKTIRHEEEAKQADVWIQTELKITETCCVLPLGGSRAQSLQLS